MKTVKFKSGILFSEQFLPHQRTDCLRFCCPVRLDLGDYEEFCFYFEETKPDMSILLKEQPKTPTSAHGS